MRATPNNPLGAVLGAADRPRQPSPSQPPLCRPAPICCATPSTSWTGRPRPGRTTEGTRASQPRQPCRVHGTASGRPRPSAGLSKSPFPWVPPASPRLAGFHTGFISVKPLDCVSFKESEQPKVQLLTVDHSARGSMKTAANCVS